MTGVVVSFMTFSSKVSFVTLKIWGELEVDAERTLICVIRCPLRDHECAGFHTVTYSQGVHSCGDGAAGSAGREEKGSSHCSFREWESINPN